MALTVTGLRYESAGSEGKVYGTMAFDSSYPTGGESIAASLLGIPRISRLYIQPEGGYAFGVDYSDATQKTVNILAYQGNATTGTTGATSGGTPAGTNGTSSVTGTGTGSVTPLGTNASSIANPNFAVDSNMAVKPVITLTHAADPTGGAVDTPLYAIEGLAGAAANELVLQSTCAGGVSVLGETADGTVAGSNASARFWVRHSAAPTGVQVYVNEGSGDRLEANFASGTAGYILMPYESPVAGAGNFGLALAVKVYHSATAATGKPVYFNDNGMADAQLIFTDTGAAGGVVPASDITVVVPGFGYQGAAGFGSAAAQTFTGSSSVVTVSSLTATAAAQVFTGSALATHTHSFAGTDAALEEVPAATDLSGLTAVEFTAFF